MSYSKGIDYNCSGAICYGIDAKDAAFRQVQALINAALARLGLGSSIAVDGKIGSGTVQAVLLLAKQPPFMSSPTLARVQASPKPDTVAMLVPELLQVFSDPTTAFDASGGPQTSTSTQNAQSQVGQIARGVIAARMAQMPPVPATPPQSPNNVGVTSVLPTAVKSHIGWWLAGLAGAAATGFLLVHIAHRRHEDDVEPPP